MEYRAIGIMSGSSLDGLDIAFVVFNEVAGQWEFDIIHADCQPFTPEWVDRLRNAIHLSAKDYLQLHADFGMYIGNAVNLFIQKHQLEHRVQIICSHGHTSFHMPSNGFTGQLGDGAAIAATTGINVVTDVRAMDVALGGQGAPIVPIGEKLLFADYPLLLNLGGIANISANLPNEFIAYDICPANRVLNLLAADAGKEYDADGEMAAKGFIRDEVLAQLNQLPYYTMPYPKSLANDFGTDVVYPLLKAANLSVADASRTMVEHVVVQLTRNIGRLAVQIDTTIAKKLLVTGGGAFHSFLMQRLRHNLQTMGIELVVPTPMVVNYKEALIMALLGVLRWRESNTSLHSVTGAKRSSIGGAVWIGQEA